MKTSFYATLLTSLALVSTFSSASFADHEGNRQGNGYGKHGYRNYNVVPQAKTYRNHHRSYGYSTRQRQVAASNSKWNWDRHNWNEQRSQLRNNWRLNNNRLSAQQQQQLDAQMKAEWLRYHNNKWNGSYSWNQYSDPNFLDYVHNSSPSLMTRIRSAVGY